MKKKNLTKLLALILCTVLIAATALFATGCKDAAKETPDTTGEKTSESDKSDKDTAADDGDKVTELGEGATQFYFTVVDKDGNETKFIINTDKKTVGEALLDLQLIEGDNDTYGLYVKRVNGIEAVYEKDKTYWAFYVNGEYAMTGVDSTEIENGAEYAFKVEK